MKSWKLWLVWLVVIVGSLAAYPQCMRLFNWVMVKERMSVQLPTDTHTALQAIFTLFAFVAVIVTLHIQRRDGDAQAAKGDFFQLLDAWQEVVHNAAFDQKKGRTVFNDLATLLRGRMLIRAGQGITDLELHIAAYESFHREDVGEALNHYFRLLYNIIKFVDEEPLFNAAEKTRLVRIVRAMISEPEYLLLFWNGASSHGEKFPALADEYDLFQNFSFERVTPEELKELYPLTYEQRRKKGLIGEARES